MGSSWTRARTHVPCIGRRILNHYTTREVPPYISLYFNDVCVYPRATFYGFIFNIQSSAIHFRVLHEVGTKVIFSEGKQLFQWYLLDNPYSSDIWDATFIRAWMWVLDLPFYFSLFLTTLLGLLRQYLEFWSLEGQIIVMPAFQNIFSYSFMLFFQVSFWDSFVISENKILLRILLGVHRLQT